MRQQINYQNTVRKIRDRYKPLFCDQNFYELNQKNFATLATKFVTCDFQMPVKPDDYEKFILNTLFLSLLRRPNDWFGGFRKTKSESPNENADSFLSRFQMKPFADILKIRWPKTICNEISVLEFLNSVKIKSIPDSVFWSLNFVTNNKKLFHITKQAPTPYELLTFQARGQRVLTFDDDYRQWPQLNYHHRDVLSFWLHDLVHAAEFFQNETQMQSQIYFYRWIELLMKSGCFSEFLIDHKNRERFDYLISDMNSHPLHLLKTLRAILDEADSRFWLNTIATTEKILCYPIENGSLGLINSKQFDQPSYDAALHVLYCINEKWVLSNRFNNQI